MKINEVLNPMSGLFSHMPQDIWGTDLDPSFLDIETFTSLGGMTASPLFLHYVHDGVLDHDGLARLIHQHYGKNWKRLWEALKAEYDIKITTTNDETRSLTREHNDLETRDLTGTKNGSVTGKDTGSSVNKRTGSIAHAHSNTTEYGSANTRENNLVNTSTNSGTDTTTDTFNDVTANDTTLTKMGAEKHANSSTETRDLAGSEGGSITHAKSGTDTGTVGHQKSTSDTGTITTDTTLDQTGTSTDDTSEGLYGVGGPGMANTERHTTTTTRALRDHTANSEVRDLHGGETDTETRNLATTGRDDETRSLNTTDKGTVGNQGSSTLTFDQRKDATASRESHTGTVSHATAHGLSTKTTDTGSSTEKHTGSDSERGADTETFNDLADTTTRDLSSTSTTTEQTTDGGTVKGQGTEKITETFHSEGSSPLRTFQALIQEEVEIRTGGGWNFTELVINDVRRLIALKIWERRNSYVEV